jgi:hypothetical protein
VRGRDNGGNHTGAVEGLEQIVDGIHVEGAHCVLVISRREDKLRQVRSFIVQPGWLGSLGAIAFDDALDDRETILSGHLHVEKDEIGMVFFDEFHRLNPVFSLRDNIDPTH